MEKEQNGTPQKDKFNPSSREEEKEEKEDMKEENEEFITPDKVQAIPDLQYKNIYAWEKENLETNRKWILLVGILIGIMIGIVIGGLFG